MRLGAVCRGNLIIEGYTNCSTHSNVDINPWLPGATGKTIDWQGNVHFCYRTPNPKEPSTTGIDGAAHPGWGDEIRDGSFGVTYRHNIVSGEMSIADLNVTQSLLRDGVQFIHTNTQYQDGNRYRQHDNIAEHNIFFRTAIGIGVTGNATGAENNIIRNNKIVANSGVTLTASNLNSSSQLVFQDNSFYINNALPSSAVIGSGNTVASQASYTTEGWVAPNRTLRKYVTEELGLTLLTWEDDPWLSPEEVALYKDSLEYDPTGMKTFMFIATAMRYGGQTPIPTSGKPTPLSDYPWDERFTAKAVVNYVRAGFNRPPINDDFILGNGNLEDYI